MKSAMTLGEIIAVLKRKNPETEVRYDFVYFVYFCPEKLRSYRGYYDQLALGYGLNDITVAQLLAECQSAVGRTFMGYKGGDYQMSEGTPVWVANNGETGGTAIVDIRDDDHVITLVTDKIDP